MGVWKRKQVFGSVKICIALAGLASLNGLHTVMGIYGLGLVASGCVRIVKAFRCMASVYIQ